MNELELRKGIRKAPADDEMRDLSCWCWTERPRFWAMGCLTGHGDVNSRSGCRVDPANVDPGLA